MILAHFHWILRLKTVNLSSEYKFWDVSIFPCLFCQDSTHERTERISGKRECFGKKKMVAKQIFSHFEGFSFPRYGEGMCIGMHRVYSLHVITRKKETYKQTNKQTNKQMKKTNKQTNKWKQTNKKQTNKEKACVLPCTECTASTWSKDCSTQLLSRHKTIRSLLFIVDSQNSYFSRLSVCWELYMSV